MRQMLGQEIKQVIGEDIGNKLKKLVAVLHSVISFLSSSYDTEVPAPKYFLFFEKMCIDWVILGFHLPRKEKFKTGTPHQSNKK